MYYADIPYLFNYPDQISEITQPFQSQLYPFPAQSLVAWQEAVEIYASQVVSLFTDIENMEHMIDLYYQKEAGIHLWKPA